MHIRFMSYMAVLLFVSACSQADMLEKFIPKQEDANARAYIQELQDRRLDNIEEHLDSSIKTPSVHATLEKMSSFFPSDSLKSIKPVGAHTFTNNGVKEVNLTYEFEYPSKWLLVNVATRSKDGKTSIIGFNVVPQADSLENINKFSLTGKSISQYAFLALAIALVIFTLVTLVACIRIRPMKRKWLWIVGILCGIGKFGLNWTSGQIFFNVITVQLFSVSAFSELYGPWMVSISFPIFAILFWIKRKTLISQTTRLPDIDNSL